MNKRIERSLSHEPIVSPASRCIAGNTPLHQAFGSAFAFAKVATSTLETVSQLFVKPNLR
ncbi:MAG: hypothetical protein QM784_25320 [Polyangiaceae bacterium]